MADDKKKGDKKPEKPKAPEGMERIPGIILWVGVALLVLSMTGFLGKFDADGDGGIDFPPSGNIVVGDDIKNQSEATVRSAPAGNILGTQEKRGSGTVKEGPVQYAGTSWYRIDYEDAPDGWVEKSQVTNVAWAFYLFNIIPILVGILQPIGIGASIVIICLMLYVSSAEKGLKAVNQKEEEAWLAKKQGANPMLAKQEAERRAAAAGIPESPTSLPGSTEPINMPQPNERWLHVERLSKSLNASDWRQAIIEADIILEEMLDTIGYEGVTIGDKLKNIEASDFNTLDQAWEAHKVRNRIAHDGSDYRLTQHDAERVIGLYREVFQEFFYI